MTKMIEILSELPHRFILSKGVIGHEFDSIMGDNMAGENYVNQLAVLQSVSMIISHAGVRLKSSSEFEQEVKLTALFSS